MTFVESSRRVRRLLAEASDTDPDDWYLCLKARFGMQIVFESICQVFGAGDVITTPYTCITAINPILAANLKPVYADIDPMLLSTNQIPSKLFSPKTRAVVMQHTLGRIGDKSSLVQAAQRHHLPIIEDSAHCLARFARDKNDQIIADISVHSFGVEKILQRTKFGGAIYVNPRLKISAPALHEAICSGLNDLRPPSAATSFRVRHYRLGNAILQRLPQGMRPSVRQLAIKTKLLEPPIYPFEQEGRQAKPVAPDAFTISSILRSLPHLRENYARRDVNVAFYNKNLSSDKFQNLAAGTTEPLLAYPILFESVTEANRAYDLLISSGFFVRRWYSPLLFPGPKYTQFYSYDPKQAPIAEAFATRVLCLPTDLSPSQIKRLVSLIGHVEKPVEKTQPPV